MCFKLETLTFSEQFKVHNKIPRLLRPFMTRSLSTISVVWFKFIFYKADEIIIMSYLLCVVNKGTYKI